MSCLVTQGKCPCEIQERDTATLGCPEGKIYCFEAESLIGLSPAPKWIIRMDHGSGQRYFHIEMFEMKNVSCNSQWLYVGHRNTKEDTIQPFKV